VRLEVRRVETISKGPDEAIGNKVRVKVVKNKVAPPFRKVELDIVFGKGISASASLLDAALNNNIIDKSGSWYSFGDERIGQGRENAKLFLEKNPDIYTQIETQVKKIILPQPSGGNESPSAGEQAASDGSDKTAVSSSGKDASAGEDEELF